MLQNSLNRIADVLQVPLAYSKSLGITGGGVVSIPMDGGKNLELKVRPRFLFNQEQVGVIFHVAGQLYVMVAFFEKTGALSAYVLDGSVLKEGEHVYPPEDFIRSNHSLRDVIGALQHSIKASYYRKEGCWKPLKIPTR